MSTAVQAIPNAEIQAWTKICEQHPNEWVCLVVVESTSEGSIRTARVIAHDASMRKLLAQLGAESNTVVVHTSGRPLRTPRIEVSDEIRDIVRPRR